MINTKQLKNIPQLVRLYNRQYNSYFTNANSSRPIKYWLDDYVNSLSDDKKCELIFNFCSFINNEKRLPDNFDELTDKELAKLD